MSGHLSIVGLGPGDSRYLTAQAEAALAAAQALYGYGRYLERVPIRAIEFHEYHDLGPYLLGAAAAVLALHALLSATWAFRLP